MMHETGWYQSQDDFIAACNTCGWVGGTWSVKRDALAQGASHAQIMEAHRMACHCHSCLAAAGITPQFMVLCSECGNKRCPHANNHEFECTGSNDAYQEGSAFAPDLNVWFKK